MKKSSLSKQIALAVSIMAFIALPLNTWAAKPKSQSEPVIVKTKTGEHLETKKRDALAEKRKQISEEAVDAAKATQKALKALENDQPKQALAALQVASGNLDLLLARDPSLGMIPIDIQARVFETDADLKTIEEIEDDLDDLIDDHRYFAARSLINQLADEIRFTTVFLPLATYPAAIDKAAPLIDAGKIDDAKASLYDALDTLVVTQEVIPLPVLRAEASLSKAFQTEHKSDLSKKETQDKIETLVEKASSELKVAETLGYGEKDDYEDLYDAINALKKAIGTAGFEGEWKKVKESLAHFKNRLVHPAG